MGDELWRNDAIAWGVGFALRRGGLGCLRGGLLLTAQPPQMGQRSNGSPSGEQSLDEFKTVERSEITDALTGSDETNRQTCFR